MLIVDAHLDLSMNALQWNRDLLASVYTIRTQENYTPGKGRGRGTVAYPEMRRGRVAVSFATLIGRSTGRPVPHIDYATPAQAHGAAQGQLAYYRALERQGHVRILSDTRRPGRARARHGRPGTPRTRPRTGPTRRRSDSSSAWRARTPSSSPPILGRGTAAGCG